MAWYLGCLLEKSRALQFSAVLQKRFRYYGRGLRFFEEEYRKAKKLNPLAKCEAGETVPDDVINPFEREKVQCVACKYGLKFDYKNGRLLSQFLSSFSGRLYEKHQTGLCDFQHQRLRVAVGEARRAAIIPVVSKDAHYFKDPRLFDPMKPSRPNPFT